MFDIRIGAVQARFFIVPKCKANRTLRGDIGCAEYLCEFHHQCSSGTIIVDGLVYPVAIHVCADDVHLVRTCAADLGAIHLGAFAIDRLLGIQCANAQVGLSVEITIHTCRGAIAVYRRATGATAVATDEATGWRRQGLGLRPRSTGPGWSRFRVIHIVQSFDIAATDIDKPLFDPVDRLAIALRTLAPITELRQALQRSFVVLQRKAADQFPGRVEF